MVDCEECGSSENVKQFRHFDTNEDEWLCWECRKPIVMERVHGENSSDEDESSDSEKSGQTKLTEQW